VVIKRKPQFEQQAAFDDSAPQARIAGVSPHSPQQNCIMRGEFFDVGVFENRARLDEMACAEGKLCGGNIHTRRHQHFERFGHNFGPNTVTGNDCKLDLRRHINTVPLRGSRVRQSGCPQPCCAAHSVAPERS
jgi:hypothetical protein